MSQALCSLHSWLYHSVLTVNREGGTLIVPNLQMRKRRNWGSREVTAPGPKAVRRRTHQGLLRSLYVVLVSGSYASRSIAQQNLHLTLQSKCSSVIIISLWAHALSLSMCEGHGDLHLCHSLHLGSSMPSKGTANGSLSKLCLHLPRLSTSNVFYLFWLVFVYFILLTCYIWDLSVLW